VTLFARRGFGKVNLEGNDRRVHKPGDALWVTGTHHIIFSLRFALQTLEYRIINQIAWQKPDPPPNALLTAFTH
jgi:site-specific DNA-methyltransferase (adenine-specific)